MTATPGTMPTLASVPNANELVAKIRNAAQLTTLLYRASGRQLGQQSVDVPLLPEVELALQRLVDLAIGNLHTVQEEAPKGISEELTGIFEDGPFEAEVILREDGSLDLEIFFRLS